jgi:hypothetical protein
MHEFVRKPTLAGNYCQKEFSSSPQNPRIRGETASRNRQGDVTAIRLKVVCGKHCNNGWMSRLETRVRPILIPLLTGSRITMNKYHQEVLATWIAMKMVVCEFSNPEDVVTPRLERSLLMGRRLPPDMTSIWIAHYNGAAWNNAYVRYCYEVGLGTNGRPPIPSASTTKNIQSQSLIAGKLLIHVLGTTLSGIKFEPQKAAAAVNAVRQIWPFQREFLWPPLYAVSDTQASLIASELDRYTVRLPFVGGR